VYRHNKLEKEVKYKTITSDTYILLPNQFVLATTMEYFELPNNLTAFVEGGAHWEDWVCLYRMQDGLTRVLKEK